MQRTHIRLVQTKSVVVIPLDHVKRVVHIVPDVAQADDSFFYLNNDPLGTTLRDTQWEYALNDESRIEKK